MRPTPTLSLLIPALLAAWTPRFHQARATESALPPRAIIKSCAQPDTKDRAAPYPAKMSAPSGGIGMMSQAPAPSPSTMMPRMEAKSMPTSTTYMSEGGRGEREANDQSLDVHQVGKKVDKNIQRASELYLSNDDSMSLASAQRIIYAINNFIPIYRNEIRPHEFLNYFHFKTNPVEAGQVFSWKPQFGTREKGSTLALAVQGKTMTLEQRRPAVMTLIVDKSGSMAAEGKMDYLKEGMRLLKAQLKHGDVLNVVEFDHETCNAIEGFVVGRDSMTGYDKTVDELAPRGSTDLHDGLVEGYKLAERFHDPSKINRVILITDAIANTGELSSDLMASIGKYYDTKRIALSGIGVGLDFNDELLDTLTEKGKGAYLFIGLREALPRVFGSDFISLLDTIARDVHFKVTFPKGLHLDVFYGEEVSTEKSKVQPIHYFANTAQLFLLDLIGKPEGEEPLKFLIEYKDPVDDSAKTQEFSTSLAQLAGGGQENIAKARALMAFATLMETTSLPGSRPYGGWRSKVELSAKQKTEGKKECAATLAEVQKQTAIYSDQETAYVTDLVNKYCARF